jgi:hypothetical protein
VEALGRPPRSLTLKSDPVHGRLRAVLSLDTHVCTCQYVSLICLADFPETFRKLALHLHYRYQPSRSISKGWINIFCAAQKTLALYKVWAARHKTWWEKHSITRPLPSTGTPIFHSRYTDILVPLQITEPVPYLLCVVRIPSHVSHGKHRNYNTPT